MTVKHKLKNQNGGFAFSECGKALHIVGGEACESWEYVTCKNCLTHIKQKEEKISLEGDEK